MKEKASCEIENKIEEILSNNNYPKQLILKEYKILKKRFDFAIKDRNRIDNIIALIELKITSEATNKNVIEQFAKSVHNSDSIAIFLCVWCNEKFNFYEIIDGVALEIDTMPSYKKLVEQYNCSYARNIQQEKKEIKSRVETKAMYATFILILFLGIDIFFLNFLTIERFYLFIMTITIYFLPNLSSFSFYGIDAKMNSINSHDEKNLSNEK